MRSQLTRRVAYSWACNEELHLENCRHDTLRTLPTLFLISVYFAGHVIFTGGFGAVVLLYYASGEPVFAASADFMDSSVTPTNSLRTAANSRKLLNQWHRFRPTFGSFTLSVALHHLEATQPWTKWNQILQDLKPALVFKWGSFFDVKETRGDLCPILEPLTHVSNAPSPCK